MDKNCGRSTSQKNLKSKTRKRRRGKIRKESGDPGRHFNSYIKKCSRKGLWQNYWMDFSFHIHPFPHGIFSILLEISCRRYRKYLLDPDTSLIILLSLLLFFWMKWTSAMSELFETIPITLLRSTSILLKYGIDNAVKKKAYHTNINYF